MGAIGRDGPGYRTDEGIRKRVLVQPIGLRQLGLLGLLYRDEKSSSP